MHDKSLPLESQATHHQEKKDHHTVVDDYLEQIEEQ